MTLSKYGSVVECVAVGKSGAADIGSVECAAVGSVRQRNIREEHRLFGQVVKLRKENALRSA